VLTYSILYIIVLRYYVLRVESRLSIDS